MQRFSALLDVSSRLPAPPFDYEADADRRQNERNAFIAEEVASLSAISQILIGAHELCQSLL